MGLTPRGDLCLASLLHGRKAVEVVTEWQAQWPRTYFAAAKPPKDALSLPLLLIGTVFHKQVWQEVMRIPRWRVTTYGGRIEWKKQLLKAEGYM